VQYQLDLLDDVAPDPRRAPRLGSDVGGQLTTATPFRVHVWRLGDGPEALRLVALTGEPVVDYSLRCKAELGWENTVRARPGRPGDPSVPHTESVLCGAFA
jgi:hypothetical protein